MSSCEQYPGPNPLLTGCSGQEVKCQTKFLEWHVPSERGDIFLVASIGNQNSTLFLGPIYRKQLSQIVPCSRKQLSVCEQAARNGAV